MGKILNKAIKASTRKVLEEVLEMLREAESQGKGSEEAADLIVEHIDELMQKAANKTAVENGKKWDFSKEIAEKTFVKDERIELSPFSESDKEFYFELLRNNELKDMVDMTEDAIQSVFNDIWNDNTDFFCVIKDNHSGEKLGYIGIKNSSKSIWEVAIELKEECRSKGYGPTAMSLFAKRIKEVAGKKQLQALVEVDNIASQRMLEKVGARLIDIRDISFKTEEESEKFEEENLQLITDRMRELAEYLEVEPRKLLSHVLEYAIFG